MRSERETGNACSRLRLEVNRPVVSAGVGQKTHRGDRLGCEGGVAFWGLVWASNTSRGHCSYARLCRARRRHWAATVVFKYPARSPLQCGLIAATMRGGCMTILGLSTHVGDDRRSSKWRWGFANQKTMNAAALYFGLSYCAVRREMLRRPV